MSSAPSTSTPLLALVGTPNSGKSTLFNKLTGLQQRIGNFPGITVEPAIGEYSDKGFNAHIVDLPGLYSLRAHSDDEEFSIAVLRGSEGHFRKPDGCVFVIDGTNLEKGLSLFSQYATLQIPTIMVVTMIDEIKAQGAVLDDIALERIVGVPVIGIVGTRGLGFSELTTAIRSAESFAVPKMQAIDATSIESRIIWARGVAEKVLTGHRMDAMTLRLDSVVLHPVLGHLVFGVVMASFFIAIFVGAVPMMDAIELGVRFLRSEVHSIFGTSLVGDFLGNGILAGVGSVVVFIPQIFLLVLFITVLEDCGYLARAAFLVDRFMGIFGLQGRSFVPLLGSFACAIPGIMSARIIPGAKDRMVTILIAPLMTCSARLPVYTLLIAACIPARTVLGFAPLQSLVLAGLYGTALVSGLCIAFVLKNTMFKADKLHFLIEFPAYRLPTMKNVSLTIWNRCRDFIRTAGTIILFISILLWILSEFPQTPVQPGASRLYTEQQQLEHSYAGQLGRTIQPLFEPLGFDWKVTVGVIGSFAARETFISVMGQMYATDIQENNQTLREVLQSSLTLPTALSILAFYIFALQCMSTIAIIKRETGSWKWSGVAFAYTFVLAYAASWCTYTVTSWFV